MRHELLQSRKIKLKSIKEYRHEVEEGGVVD